MIGLGGGTMTNDDSSCTTAMTVGLPAKKPICPANHHLSKTCSTRHYYHSSTITILLPLSYHFQAAITTPVCGNCGLWMWMTWLITIQIFLHKKGYSSTKWSIIRETKICWEKKYTATDEREWVSAEKKIYQRKKKYTAFDQKEWVSGNVIFSQKKKYTLPLRHL